MVNFVRWMSLGVLGGVLCATAACSSGSAATGSTGGRGGGRGGRGGDGGAVPVVTAQVSKKDVPIAIDAIGNVEAFESVSVRSQVTGTVTEVLFHEGDFVKAGDHLFTIDQRPFQAALDQAQANLVRDQALLEQAQAQVAKDKAQADYRRISEPAQQRARRARDHLEGRRPAVGRRRQPPATRP